MLKENAQSRSSPLILRSVRQVAHGRLFLGGLFLRMPTLHLYPDCARSDLEIRVLAHRLPTHQSGSTRTTHLLREDADNELPLPHPTGE